MNDDTCVARENADLANEILVLQEEKDLLLWLLAEQQYRCRRGTGTPQPGDLVRVEYRTDKGGGHFYDENVRPNGTYCGYQDVIDAKATVTVKVPRTMRADLHGDSDAVEG